MSARHGIDRRQFLAAAGGGLLLAALGACSRKDWPEGMAEIKWDRDTCTRCKMVISDRRFAAEARGGPQGEVFKFDDIGCLSVWLAGQPWARDPASRLWVADIASRGNEVAWLDARRAYYSGGRVSPMGYNLSASATPQPGALDFEAMREHVLAKGR